MTDSELYQFELSSQRAKKEKLKELKLTYRQYLNSNHWHNFREVILSQRDYTCEGCGVFTSRSSRFKEYYQDIGDVSPLLITLEIHHEDYHNLGKEKPEDVTVLCRKCHQMNHDAIEDFMFLIHQEYFS